MKNLFAYLEKYQTLSDDLKTFLAANLIPRSFPARHPLLEVPKVASHIYYLQDGFAMSYTFNREGKTTENFWKPGQIIVAFESFMYQRPSFEVIQLVKPSDLLCMSYEAMNAMFEMYPESNTIYRMLINQHHMYLKKKLRLMKQQDHIDQYQKLLEYFPGIERSITQRAIATYLGITPQTLSRLKRNR